MEFFYSKVNYKHITFFYSIFLFYFGVFFILNWNSLQQGLYLRGGLTIFLYTITPIISLFLGGIGIVFWGLDYISSKIDILANEIIEEYENPEDNTIDHPNNNHSKNGIVA